MLFSSSGASASLSAYFPTKLQRSLISLNSERHYDDGQIASPRHKKVRINVSGEIYETFDSTLNKYPETLLGTSEKRKELSDPINDEIFLNRNRKAFEAILFYYQSTGVLSCPNNVNMPEFLDECQFYQIPVKAVKRMTIREQWLYKKKRHLPTTMKVGSFRHSCWLFMDIPRQFKYPTLAFVYLLFSYAAVLASIALFCYETEMFYQERSAAHDLQHLEYIYMLEIALNLYTALELVARFIVNPWPKRFFKIPLNCVELISSLLFLIMWPTPESALRRWSIDIARLLRAFRLVRVSKWSKLVKAAASVVQSSLNEVVAVSFVTLIVCILGGSIMYYIEMEEPGTGFTSIPQSMWWAIQTVLCVGYGDITPTSVMGKCIGGCVLYLGVVSTAIMLLSLGGRIFDMYSKEISNRDFLPEQGK